MTYLNRSVFPWHVNVERRPVLCDGAGQARDLLSGVVVAAVHDAQRSRVDPAHVVEELETIGLVEGRDDGRGDLGDVSRTPWLGRFQVQVMSCQGV